MKHANIVKYIFRFYRFGCETTPQDALNVCVSASPTHLMFYCELSTLIQHRFESLDHVHYSCNDTSPITKGSQSESRAMRRRRRLRDACANTCVMCAVQRTKEEHARKHSHRES